MSDRRRVLWVGMAVLALAGVAAYWFRPPPQMGVDPDVFETVDALYTAVRLKDAGRVTACEQRLHAARDAGKLPASAAGHLDGVIGRARDGGWQAAAERLYDFMLAQRREGELPPPAPKPKAKGKGR